ncbi:alcohol dehydrogenase [Cupriavidus sp. USMAA2-4]|uniref:NAD(P)-binding protein n=1 Tax=Cupriavidus sp. USMAA2-4 TaxID=876364 RepID=UPI0008A6CC45|nr:FAD/NAD(P)-binding protein [Cupriavidus sp. USMAA2-4]AOY90683.1 alcohol dehydrogenase [Cupriavidus sp. USMAA2-4]
MTITRRDFLNGSALALGTAFTPGWLRAAQAGDGGAGYPPALTGLRGSQPGSYTLAHSLAREGVRYPGVMAREAYDLVVVGSGISGLAAAWFYQRRHGPGARILILDNHDDFGGHARRNEFTVRGRLLVSYGGSAEMPAGAAGSAALRTLLDGIGLAPGAGAPAAEPWQGSGLGRAVFFDREHFGADRLVAGDPFGQPFGGAPAAQGGPPAPDAVRRFLAAAPLPAADREALARLAEGRTDYLAGMAADDRAGYLRRTRYALFLRDKAGLGLAGVRFLRSRSNDSYALDADGISIWDALGIGLPAGAGMPAVPPDARLGKSPASRLLHADGNASIARGLVRDLIPAVAPGAGALAQARFDYDRLDRDGAPVRLRLNSTAVAVEPGSHIARVTYGWQGNLHRVEARHVVLAGYNMMVPFLMPGLPAAQRAALRDEVKAPLVYTKVALDNWQAFAALGAGRIHAPTLPYSDLWLEAGPGARPQDPVVLHMLYVPTVPDSGMRARERFRAGRALLLGTPFVELERAIRSQLDRLLAPAGSSAAQLVRAITVNRWSHGYSYRPSSVDGDDAGTAAQQAARAGVGNVALAGADSGGSPSLVAAVEQAWRAVESLPA